MVGRSFNSSEPAATIRSQARKVTENYLSSQSIMITTMTHLVHDHDKGHSSWGWAEREPLISFLWWPVPGPEVMARSCIREGSGWMLGNSSSLRGWSGTVTAWQSTSVWTVLSETWLLGSPVQTQELDSMIPVDSFLLRIFYDSMMDKNAYTRSSWENTEHWCMQMLFFKNSQEKLSFERLKQPSERFLQSKI